MLAKRRLFGALLFMLTLLSSAACAKLNLKPYEVPSASGTEVEILAPEVYLLLHDSPLNGGKLKTALVLLDHGQTVFEQRLPDHTADSENLSYRLLVADANRYGILTTESHSNFIRFRLLEDGALSEGFSVQGDLTGYAASLGWLCNLSWEGGAYAVNRFDWNGILLASTPVSPLHAATYGGFTVLADKSVAYIAPDIDISQGRYALNHLRVSADGEPLSAVHIPLPSDSSTTYGAFSPDGGMLSYTESHALTEPSQFFLARSDAAGRLLFTKMLKAADINVRVNCALLRDDGSTTLYGTATRTARKYFAVFRLDLDAGGNIIARDVRDFTIRATYLYSVKLDPLGNAYVVAQDYKHPIAVVPFDALPVCDNPGLTLTNDGI